VIRAVVPESRGHHLIHNLQIRASSSPSVTSGRARPLLKHGGKSGSQHAAGTTIHLDGSMLIALPVIFSKSTRNSRFGLPRTRWYNPPRAQASALSAPACSAELRGAEKAVLQRNLTSNTSWRRSL
jgi:hypothetical protein